MKIVMATFCSTDEGNWAEAYASEEAFFKWSYSDVQDMGKNGSFEDVEFLVTPSDYSKFDTFEKFMALDVEDRLTLVSYCANCVSIELSEETVIGS
jgi:hypothetical protein